MGALDLIIGPVLVGVSLNTYLYGLVTYQFLVYHNTQFKDPMWIRTVVGILFVLDTAHSATGIYQVWDMTVTNYNNPEALYFVGWTVPFTACATVTAALITQAFLGHRVLILTKSKLLTALIGVCSIASFACGIYSGIKCGMINDGRLFDPLKPVVIGWLGFQTLTDVLITVVLAVVLSRSRTGFRRTDTIINRLIRGAVQTGLFASIFALGDLFAFTFRSDTHLYATFVYPIGRIYTNTLLDTLNARSSFRRAIGASDCETDNNGISFRFQGQSQAGIDTLHSIHVQQEVVSDGKRSVDGKFALDRVYGSRSSKA